MDNWLQERSIRRYFKISFDPASPRKYTYTCTHCHWKTVLLFHEDEICLSHAQRHVDYHCVVSNAVLDPRLDKNNAEWKSRGFRDQRKQYNLAIKPDQTTITDYFDIDKFTSSIDDVIYVRKKMNESIGTDETVTDKPILDLVCRLSVVSFVIFNENRAKISYKSPLCAFF